MSTFKIFSDGRAAGSPPVSGSDFVNKNTLEQTAVLSTSVRRVLSISAEDYAELDNPDPETLYILNNVSALKAPVTVYSTNGTTGLLGHNSGSLEGNWQLQNLDLTNYVCVECYFKAAATGSADALTPAVVVKVPLNEAAESLSAYYGSAVAALPFDRSREYLVGVAVDSTKTKLQVIHQNILYNGSVSDANNTDRYCYKIVGYYQ